jgi:hypothetical protein
MNLEDDIYHVQPHLQKPSYNDLDINEKPTTKGAIKGDSSLHAPFDPILDCGKTFQECIVG